MASNKMSYQRARGLKNKGLGSLIVDRIVSGEGVGRSIKSSISDKTVAKFTRIKEKFDPLNIGKAVGGRLGAYALGRLTGRSNEDISYFTGTRIKAKPVEAKMNPLVTKVAEGDRRKLKRGDGLADVMSKVYNLIKSNIEDQKTQHEVEHAENLGKEKQRSKWHEELIKALCGFSGKTTTVTVQKKDGGGFLDGIIKMVEDFVENMFGGMLKKIKDFFSGGIFESLFNFLKGPVFRLLSSGAKWLFALLTGPEALIAALVAGGLAAAIFAGRTLASFFEKSQEDKAQEQGGKKAVAALQKQRAANDALNESGMESEEQSKAKEEYDAAVKEKQGLVTAYMNKKGYKKFKKTFMGFETGGVTFEDKNGKEAPESLLKEANDFADKSLEKTATPVAPAAQQTAVPAESKPASASPGAPSTATSAPPEPSGTGARVQSAISQNNDMNLEPSAPQVVTIDNSKSINAGGGSSAPAVSMDSSVTVRTDDPTLQNIFKKLARQV